MKFSYKHINFVLLKSDWTTLRKEINSLPSKEFNSVESLEVFIERVNDKGAVIERLIKAMKLGNTATLQEIYATAGVEFDFTKEKVKEVGTFLTKEWNQLKLELEKRDR